MPAWSNSSCAQWMLMSRAPSAPSSRIGERPAVTSIGTRSRAALATAHTAFAVPTLTCNISACGRPETR